MRCRCVILGLIGATLVGVGCESTPPSRSSRLTAPDIIEAASAIRESLGESPLLVSRTRESAPIKLGLVEAVNKSADRLAAADRWALTALVVYDRSVQTLFEERNVRLYLPEDTESTLDRLGLGPSGRLDGRFPLDRSAPTHILRAEVRSIARQGSAGARSISDERYDVFVIDYRITEFQTSDVVWARTVEVSREAGGTVAD